MILILHENSKKVITKQYKIDIHATIYIYTFVVH